MTEWVPPQDLLKRLREAHREGYGRMTDVPAFEMPMNREYIDALLSEGPDPGDAIPITDPALVAAVEAELPVGATLRIVSGDVGRGASGYGAVVEVLGVISDVGGTIAFGVGAYRVVKKMYDGISRHLNSPPCVSLGTARFLAMAHLAEHLGSDNFALVGSGDLSDSPPDFSYTGFDNFWVALSHEDRLYSYVVDARGRAHLVGSLPFVRTEPLGYRTVMAEQSPKGASAVDDEQ